MSGLPHHELFTAFGVFVVEEDARAGEQVVAFAIVDSGLVAEQLGSRVRAASPDYARQQHAQGIASPALVARARSIAHLGWGAGECPAIRPRRPPASTQVSGRARPRSQSRVPTRCRLAGAWYRPSLPAHPRAADDSDLQT